MLKVLERRSNAALAVAVAALVLAIGGGSWALAGSGSSGQKYAKKGKSKKHKQAKRGPRGRQGRQGPVGTIGPQGPAGPGGPNGARGAAGARGEAGPSGASGTAVLHGAGAPPAAIGQQGDFYIDTAANAIYGPKSEVGWGAGTSLIGPQGVPGGDGAAGKSVISIAFEGSDEPAGEPCEGNGGASFEIEDSGTVNYICNGAGGGAGVPETLKGSWSLGQLNAAAADEPLYVSISFGIPLEAAPVTEVKQKGYEGTAGQPCPGKATEPLAAPGTLCVYTAEEVNLKPLAVFGGKKTPDAKSGAVLRFQNTVAGPVSAYGTWAVTPAAAP